jgi:hypothetical protein
MSRKVIKTVSNYSLSLGRDKNLGHLECEKGTRLTFGAAQIMELRREFILLEE